MVKHKLKSILGARLPNNTIYSIKDTKKNKAKLGLTGMGIYRKDLKVILVDSKYKTNPRLRNHEKGHYIWHRRMTPAVRSKWIEICKKDKISFKSGEGPTHGTPAEEAFAIFYAHYKQGLSFKAYGANIKPFFVKYL